MLIPVSVDKFAAVRILQQQVLLRIALVGQEVAHMKLGEQVLEYFLTGELVH